jgi:hypothetical protein
MENEFAILYLACDRNTSEFTTLSTTSILPVDLNVYILKVLFNYLTKKI